MIKVEALNKVSLRLLSIGLVLLPAMTYADQNLLSVKPSRCIALHEGQVCYQTLSISWQADRVDSYCLYQQDIKTPLMCWESLAVKKWNYEFESKTTQKFILVRKQDAKLIAEASIEVAWVYDASSRRESHWRIF